MTATICESVSGIQCKLTGVDMRCLLTVIYMDDFKFQCETHVTSVNIHQII